MSRGGGWVDLPGILQITICKLSIFQSFNAISAKMENYGNSILANLMFRVTTKIGSQKSMETLALSSPLFLRSLKRLRRRSEPTKEILNIWNYNMYKYI